MIAHFTLLAQSQRTGTTMGDNLNAAIESALTGYTDKYLGKNLVESKCIKSIEIDGGTATLDVVMGYPCSGYADEMRAAITPLQG